MIDGEATILDGRDSSTWIDVVLRGEVEHVHAGSKTETSIVGILNDGVVPAGGFLLHASGPLEDLGKWDAAVQALQGSPATTPSNDPKPEPDESDSVRPSPAHSDEESAPALASDDANHRDDKAVTGMFARLEELSREQATSLIGDIKDDASDDDEVTSLPASGPSPFDGLEPPPIKPADKEVAPGASATATMWRDRPELRGVQCPNRHFTPANEPICRTCGADVDPKAPQISAIRPILGHLMFDDGAVLDIDRPAVVGADVPTGYVVNDEPTTIVRLDDGHGGVSSVQLEVRPVGWNVEIVDMESENGTYTMLQGERQTRTRLRSGQSVVLQDGMTVETGTRTFTFGFGPHR